MYNYPFLVAIVVGPRLSPISLFGILVSLSTACLADIPLYHVDIPDCSICLVVQQALRGRCQSVRCGRDIVQTHRSNQWLFGIFYTSNRFSHKSHFLQRFCLPCSSSQRTFCFVMMLLPQVRSMLATSRIRMRCTKERRLENFKSFSNALNHLLIGLDVFPT